MGNLFRVVVIKDYKRLLLTAFRFNFLKST